MVALPAIERADVIPLSERDMKLLSYLQEDLAAKQMADRLRLSISTTKWHLSRLYAKLGVKTRLEAVVKAMKLGIIE